MGGQHSSRVRSGWAAAASAAGRRATRKKGAAVAVKRHVAAGTCACVSACERARVRAFARACVRVALQRNARRRPVLAQGGEGMGGEMGARWVRLGGCVLTRGDGRGLGAWTLRASACCVLTALPATWQSCSPSSLLRGVRACVRSSLRAESGA